MASESELSLDHSLTFAELEVVLTGYYSDLRRRQRRF